MFDMPYFGHTLVFWILDSNNCNHEGLLCSVTQWAKIPSYRFHYNDRITKKIPSQKFHLSHYIELHGNSLRSQEFNIIVSCCRLLVFCCCCSAAAVLLMVFCCCRLLLVFCYRCSAAGVMLLMFCWCRLLLVFRAEMRAGNEDWPIECITPSHRTDGHNG